MASANTFSSLSDTVSLRLQHRLIAVWALAEGVLGGVLHALHLPVTGLVVGSIAVCCLSLLARFRRRRGDLLKATIMVLLVKAMLSPHAPLAAYIAVLSQGLLAELFFRKQSNFRLNCILFGFFTQLQSAILHLMKLVIVFGISIWSALDQYLAKVVQSLGLEHTAFSLYFAIAYLVAHALTGILIGVVATKLPGWLPKNPQIRLQHLSAEKTPEMPIKPPSRRKKLRLQFSFVLIWLVLLGIFLQSYFGIGPVILPETKLFQVLIRSVLIVSVWYFVVSPLLLKVLKNWLAGKSSELSTELALVLDLLPETGYLVKSCWRQSASQTGFTRLKVFLKQSLQQLLLLPEETPEQFSPEK